MNSLYQLGGEGGDAQEWSDHEGWSANNWDKEVLEGDNEEGWDEEEWAKDEEGWPDIDQST